MLAEMLSEADNACQLTPIMSLANTSTALEISFWREAASFAFSNSEISPRGFFEEDDCFRAEEAISSASKENGRSTTRSGDCLEIDIEFPAAATENRAPSI